MTGAMAMLRRWWKSSSRLVRLGWVLGVVVAIGLVANLVIRPTPIVYAGTFTTTGSMTTPREGATATLLPDGRVLVAGGSSDGKAVLGSAELYDPARGTFSLTGSMTTPRANATAVLLLDGRVLVAGGGGGDPNAGFAMLSSAELYDPGTGMFTPTGSLATARAFGTMSLLADGRVLMAGGSNERDRVELASAELYDPHTGMFSGTGALTVGREAAAAAVLPDGRVLIAGGAISIDANAGSDTASAELYDPETGAFSATGSMAAALEWRSATLLIDGTILVVGGRGLGPLLGGSVSAEIYDPETGTFSSSGGMHSPRAGPRAVGLGDGRVLVVGGPGPAELFDPLRGVFSETGSMAEPRSGGTATILSNHQVLIAGGTVGSSPIGSAELFR